jgi:hypothetical protein
MTTLREQADRLEAGIAAILALQPRVETAGPWPLAELYGNEAEASWGPPELLAHLDEALPFWLGEVERILDGPAARLPVGMEAPSGAAATADAGVPFGRGPADTSRTDLIGRDRTVPLRELFARLGAAGVRVAKRMRELTSEQAAAVGLHPARGGTTVEDLFERFVTSHVEGHVAQLRAILDDAGA